MSNVLIGGSSGGAMSDECTAILADVAKGKTAVTKDSDDEIGVGTLELTGNAGTGDVIKGVTFYNNDLYTKRTGTLELTGNATVGYVYSGKTFYSTNTKQKLTGTMTVNSLLSFSVAVSSGRRVTATWKNPKAATGKPYSGVYIKYSTSGYPGKGGTQIYKGAGNNTSSEGMSSASFNLPNLNTTYYLSVYPYVTCSVGEMTGNYLNASVKTGGQMNQTFTSTQNYTIPAGYTSMDVFCVGGGGRGSKGYNDSDVSYGGGGGGSGYTSTKLNIAVSSGQVINVVIGAGSSQVSFIGKPTYGGTTSISRSGTSLCSASGGQSGLNMWNDGTNGGSGGGAGAYCAPSDDEEYNATAGGSNGSNASDNWISDGGNGQGTTTRAFGESSGTLYAGGGGGGGAESPTHVAAAGGSGGGGRGGNGSGYNAGSAGSANTGGGGGGGGGRISSTAEEPPAGNGGSGIVLIRLK